MEDADMYDEFGNYIGPELGGEQEGEDSNDQSDSDNMQDESDQHAYPNVSANRF
jgi:hypothetical protein